MESTELYHYGVLGMKLGVRRFQKKDGSLTPAGKKRYYDTPELNAQKAEMKSAKRARNIARNDWNNSHGYQQYAKNQKRYLAANAEYNRAKLKYQTNKEVARIREKGIEFKKKSKHRLDLEEKYKKLGMDDEQAQAAANNRIRTEKILAVTAGLTIAAAAAYTTNKIVKNRIDGVIKAGENLQRIEMQDTGGKLHEVFYVAQGKHDTKRYYNLLGATRQKQTGEAYVMKLMASKDVKVASKDKCRKVFNELMKTDPDFKKAVGLHVPGIGGLSKKAQYDRFNQALVEMRNQGPDKAFYAKLKAAGYGAIQDINDMKFSGYAAKNPLIVFDNSSGNIGVKSVKKIAEDLGRAGSKELGKAMGETLVKEALETYGPLSVVAVTGAAAYTYKADPTKQVQQQGGTLKWR
jgi:hypothetical protein